MKYNIILILLFFLHSNAAKCQENFNNSNYKKYNYLYVHTKKSRTTYIGEGLCYGGLGLMAADAIISYAYGERLNNDSNPVNIPYRLQVPLAIAGITGLCSAFYGTYLMNKGELKDKKQRYSIVGTGNQVGIVYNFK